MLNNGWKFLRRLKNEKIYTTEPRAKQHRSRQQRKLLGCSRKTAFRPCASASPTAFARNPLNISVDCPSPFATLMPLLGLRGGGEYLSSYSHSEGVSLNSKAGLLRCARNDRYAFTLSEGATRVAMLDNTRKAAFTLAEVLITLGIIGIVAAMTLPNLIADYREKQTVTQFKHAVSLFSQGFTAMANDAGGQLTNLLGPWDDFRHLDEDFYKQYFKITKMCIPYGSYEECIPYKYYALDKQTETNDFCGTYSHVGKLANGIIFCIATPNGREEGWQDRFVLNVDLNGAKGPNALGIDAFRFFVTNVGTVIGSVGTCDKVAYKGNARDGWRCSEWIIKNGNMDYLKRSIPNWSDEWNH